MMVLRSLPLYLALLMLDLLQFLPGVHASNILSRAVEKTHRVAARHTHSIARDLRLAFGAVLASDSSQEPLDGGRYVYCKSGGARTGLSGGNGTISGGSSSESASAASATGSSTKSASSGGPTATPVSTPWKVAEFHNGTNFFDGWSFNTGADPTHGAVDYQTGDQAFNAGLAFVNKAGNAVMKVDTTQTIPGNRKSVRITTNSQYDQGIWIMDAVHMPTGCSVWPAWWMNGPNWPAGGEIDVVEGVNDYIANQATVHTDPGCHITSDNSATLGISGTVIGGTNCAAAETNNQGCGVRANDNSSFGAAFNKIGGGVYAMKLDDTGVSVYWWPRDQIPNDIAASTPQPSGWGAPMAAWGPSACDTSKYFYKQSAIFDTTLCGDWAGSAWTTSGIPGQAQSCAQRTGYDTCEAFVKAQGSAFSEAYWEIRSVKIYEYQS